MANYIANPSDATKPLDSDLASTMAAEFRALKGKVNNSTSPSPVWNTADAGASLLISNGNLLAINTNPVSVAPAGVRGTASVSGFGYYVYETLVGNIGGLIYIGASTLLELVSFPMGSNPGNSVHSAMYRNDGNIYYNNAIVSVAGGYTTGMTIGVVFNMYTGVSFYRNGVLQGTVAWNVAVQTLPKYPYVGIANYADYITSNFGQSTLVYSYGNNATPFYQQFAQFSGRQNLIINSQMQYDQRFTFNVNNPALTNTHIADRWRFTANVAGKISSQVFLTTQAEQLTTSGSLAYLRTTCMSVYIPAAGEYFYISQKIEGLRAAKLLYGTVSPVTCTLLFYVRSSLAGGSFMAGSVSDQAGNWSFPFSFTTPVSGAFSRVAIVIPGSIQGAWAIDNTAAIEIKISLGAGATFTAASASGAWQNGNYISVGGAGGITLSLSATFDITGVEFKPGVYSVSTPVEAYDNTAELTLCQRFFFKHKYLLQGYTGAGAVIMNSFALPTQLRTAAPVTTVTSPSYVNASNLVGNMLDTNGVYFTSVGGVALGNFTIQATVTFDAEF